jgi:predicted Zn-dependent protease
MRRAMRPSAAQLAEIQALYDQGLFLSAHRRAAGELGPYREWEGAPALVLAGRLVGQLGAPRQSGLLMDQAFKADPKLAGARFYRALRVLHGRGPLPAWQLLRREGEELEGADPDTRASWLALHAQALAALRDFERAWKWYERALAAGPASAWVRSRKVELLEREDRLPEALQAARESLAAFPWHRPSVMSLAHQLTNVDRVGEAVDLLVEAERHVEAADVPGMLGGLLEECERHVEARACWDRVESLWPLLEPPARAWLQGRRSDSAYHLGEFARAARLARRAREGFYKKIAPRLEALTGAEKVVRLPVGFVKQHHMTCAPATVAMLSGYWKAPLDHLALAEEICYGGTPEHVQRDFLERHGWISRPFTVTWDAAVALLDRGVPFAMGTREVSSGHLQAVVGYDARRRTLLLRDPNHRRGQEVESEGFLERYRSCGPRGVALVPRAEAARLEGLTLPDTALYDLEHQALRALARHDRPGAVEACQELSRRAPDGWITHLAAIALAHYDGHQAARLKALDALVRLFPDDARFAYERMSCLHELLRGEDRVRQLRDFALSRRRGGPVFWEYYAEELRTDAREHPAAMRLLRRAIAAAPDGAMAYHILADLLLQRRELDEALELYRLSACLDDTDEHLSYAYFHATRDAGRVEQGVGFLLSRARRFAKRSSAAARTAFDALDALQRAEEGFLVLDEVLSLRPDDGELLLFMAGQHARIGQFDEAERLCEQAKGRARLGHWRRVAASLARDQGQADQARQLWQEVAADEPTARDAHAELAADLADREGLPAALAFLEAWAKGWPHNYAVWQLYVEWMRRGGPAEAEACQRRLLEMSPSSAWALRELGWNLLCRRRHAEAEELFLRSLQIDPNDAFAHAALARAARETGRRELAAQRARDALALDADSGLALEELLSSCASLEERRAALGLLHAELLRQSDKGDGLEVWHNAAEGMLGPDEILAALQAYRERRPDEWQAWLGLARQLSAMHRVDEAAQIAREACGRFPLLPRAWLERARVARIRGDGADEKESLERALALSPGSSDARRLLADWHDARGELAQARAQLEQAVATAPRDAANHGCLADVLWRQGLPQWREKALEEIEKAIRLDPGYLWAWGQLEDWGKSLGRPGLAAKLARELAEKRPDDPNAWMRLANWLAGPERLEERLGALGKAIALSPQLVPAHVLRAELLAEAGRLDEARAACEPKAFEGQLLPARLSGCKAYLRSVVGDLQGAVEQMRQVLAAEPDHYGGWGQLADWAAELKDHALYLSAARRMVELRPGLCVAHGYLGHALLLGGDKLAAKAALREALLLDSSYAFAAHWAFELLLEDGELAQADRVLETLRGRAPQAVVLSREVRLACKGKTPADGLARLEQLCRTPAEDWEPIRAALEALWGAGLGEKAEAAIEAQVVHPEASVACGSAWAAIWDQRKLFAAAADAVETALAGLGSKAAHRAAGELVEHLADAGQHRSVERLRRSCGDWLARDDFSWAAVGYALYKLDSFRDAVDWLAGFQERRGLRPWMLGCLSASSLALRGLEQGFAVARHAATLEPDGASVRLGLVATLGDALVPGRIDQAAAKARSVRLANEQTPSGFLRQLIEALAGAAQAPGRGLGSTTAPTRLAEARRLHPKYLDCVDDAVLYGLVVRRLGEGRPLWTRLWSLAERVRVGVGSRVRLWLRRMRQS